MKTISFKILSLPLLTALILSSPFDSKAQLHGSVAVEGEYAPEIIEVERISVYPIAVKFPAPTAALKFEQRGIVADFAPQLLTMGVTGWQALRPNNGYRGYASLRLGSYLNSNLSAGYSILRSEDSRLDASLQFNSSSLLRPESPYEDVSMPRRSLYDGNLSLGYSRHFKDNGSLEASLSYRLGYFNYTMLADESVAVGQSELKAPSQTLNAFSLVAKWTSEAKSDIDRPEGNKWYAGAAFNWFGYRSLPFDNQSFESYSGVSHSGEAVKGDREAHITLSGGYNLALSAESAFTVDATLDGLFYSTDRPAPDLDLFIPFAPEFEASGIMPLPSNYAIIGINPAYKLINDNLALSLGAKIDLAFNAMGNTPGSHYSLFHIAPDVKLDWRKSGIGLFAHATGGSRLRTLRAMEQFDYYQLPALLSTQPLYTPLNAEAGVTAGPFSGFSAVLAAGYEITLHTPLSSRLTDFSAGTSMDLHGFKASLSLQYAYGDMAGVTARGEYTPQNGKEGIFNGYDRLRWILGIDAFYCPIERLRIEAGYQYRGVRNLYGFATSDNSHVGIGEDSKFALESVRLPDITDLRAGVIFNVSKNFSLSCHAFNLLNLRTPLLPGIPAEGLAIIGGLDLRF